MNLIHLSARNIKAQYIYIDVKESTDFHLIVIEKPSGKNISCLKGRNCDGLIYLPYFTNFKVG